MSRGVNLARRKDLEAALARAKQRDEISLDGLATLWGVSKQRFVNQLRDIEKLMNMPAYRTGARGVHIYPARKAIRTLLAYERRNDRAEQRLQERTAKILGRGGRRPKSDGDDDALLDINQLATLSRVMAETEQRERDQGLYVEVAEMAATAGRVFSMLSGYLSELDSNIDPNGLLPADVRAVLREGGRSLALAIHAEMKDMLNPNATPKSKSSGRRRSADGRARGAPTRRAPG